jgi:cardiolipin synthase (CMP-forming)
MLLLGTAVAQFTESSIDIAPTFLGKGATFLQLSYVLLVIFLSSRQMDLSMLSPLLIGMVGFTVCSGCHYLYRGYRSVGSTPS